MARPSDSIVWWALAGIFALWTWGYIAHPGGTFTHEGRIHADGLYNYAWLHSWVVGGDFDLTDDYARLGNPHRYVAGATGHPANPFGIGAAVSWLPTFALARTVVYVADWLGVDLGPGDPGSVLVQRVTLFGSLLWAWVAMVLTAKVARHHASPRAVALACVLVAVATPLDWYATRQPSWSHAASAFAGSAVVAHLVHTRGRDDLGRFAAAGALTGLAALIRPQDIVFGILPLGAWIASVGRAQGPISRRAIRRMPALLVLCGCAGLAFVPQMWAWHAVYGRWLLVPQGTGFLHIGDSQWVEVLWSSRAGLFSWSPVAYAGMLGLGLGLLRGRGSRRWLAGGLLAVFAVTAWLMGIVDDWWGGHAFGGRRFVGCTVAFGLGLALALDVALQRRPAWLLRPGVLVLALLLVRFDVSLQRDYLHGRVARGVPISFGPVLSRAFGRAGEAVHAVVGNPGAAPVSWIFAARHGVSPARWDETVGWTLVQSKSRVRGWDRLWLHKPRWALRGLGPVQRVRGQRARLLEEGRADIAIPLRAPLYLHARLRAFASREGARLRLRIDDTQLAVLPIAPGWHDHDFDIAAESLDAGTNVLVVEADGDADIALAWLGLWTGDNEPP